MKGKTVLYVLESYNLKMIVLLHIISLLVQIFFMRLYVAHVYVGLGCLFHTAKVPSANNCYILNFFQEYLHCNTFCSYKPICLYIYSCVIFRVSESLLFLKLVLCILFSLCGLLVHQFQCKQYSITVVLLLYKKITLNVLKPG